MLKLMCFSVLGYLVLLSSVSFAAATEMNAAEMRKKQIQVYSHRGMRAFAPENSIPGYDSSLKIGTDSVDMDVVLTKDGEILVTHDPLLNPDIVRTADGKFLAKNREAMAKFTPEEKKAYIEKYAVKNLTLKQTRLFDVGRLNPDSAYSKFFPDQIAVDGTTMPSLREVIRYVKKRSHGKVGFQIEMKTDPAHPEYSADAKKFAESLYKILKSENILGNSEIQAFDFRCLTELTKLGKKVKTAFLTSRDNEKGGVDDFMSSDLKVATLWTGGALMKDHGGSIPKMVKAMGGFAWEPEDAELTEATLKEAHDLGLKVVVWSWPEMLGTAFDPILTAKMIDWGVDGIITDDPGRLISMLAVRGKPLPERH